MKLVFETAGETLIERELVRFRGRVTDARPAFSAIADLFIEETKVQFDTQGRHASGGWKPLKPETIHRKRVRGLRLEILQETGELMASLTVKGDRNMVLNVGRDSLVFGSKLPYAEAHQNPKPGSHLPQRRPLDFTEATRRSAVKIIQTYVVTGNV